MRDISAHFFSDKNVPKNESKIGWRGLAGQGGAWCCCSQALLPVLAPLSLKANPPPALYLVHTTQLPLAPAPGRHKKEERAPRPKCVADAPSCTSRTYPPLPCFLARPICCSPKVASLSSGAEQPELLEIPVGHRSVSATSITNLS